MGWRTVIAEGEDGLFVAEWPALPGCISQGRTPQEAVENIAEAIRGYLKSLEKTGDSIPTPITEEFIDAPAV